MATEKAYYVYMLCNWNNTVLYIGVTGNLPKRLVEHRNKIHDGFSQKYNLSKLVYFEQSSDVIAAIGREKQLKKWRREKKNKLVETINPTWCDLSLDWE
jgi:putative endonuclease|tara:strand:+ start:235 stop:531 length:297 start_codon:yes stop_codon:yes gene_type:complete